MRLADDQLVGARRWSIRCPTDEGSSHDRGYFPARGVRVDGRVEAVRVGADLDQPGCLHLAELRPAHEILASHQGAAVTDLGPRRCLKEATNDGKHRVIVVR